MKSTAHTEPRVHGRSSSSEVVSVLRSGATAVAICPPLFVGSHDVSGHYSATPSTDTRALTERDVRREREDDHRAHDRGDSLETRTETSVQHRPTDREQLLPR